MMVDTTIYGYYHEGAQVCPSCVIISDETNEPSTDWVPMYSHDDDSPYGTECDKCYETIFEPDPYYFDECESYHYSDDEAAACEHASLGVHHGQNPLGENS